MDDPVFFGEWLRQRRQALDLTREELAQCAGCSVSALRKIETDERRPSKQLANLLADCLDVPLDQRPAFIKAARGELRGDRMGPAYLAQVHEHRRPAPLFNVPAPLTPLIGRESELTMLEQLLRDPQCRLLTVIGAGGIGKTRLALEVASRERESFADGVCFVPLAPLSAPDFVAPAIADALGLAFFGSTDPTVQLLNFLRDKTLLLLLDSAEHLLAGLGILSELLQSAPGVKLLITSRQRLELQGEWAFELQGLPVPPDTQQDKLEDYSAVALFLHVARQVQAGIGLAEDEQPAIGHICRLLEGMPLGIELAAAWVRLLSCREIAQEIERSLDFLATTKRDVPQRHRSLRAVFDHSWDLLSEQERGVLRRLALFRGGFCRQAAEQVAGANLSLLMTLVDKSLLQRNEAGRYDLHELVRQFAQAKLEARPEELATVGDRHTAYYTDFVQELEPALKGEQQLQALADISSEIDNIRLAWRWAVTHGQVAVISKPIQGFWFFYEIRGWFQEAESAFRWAAEELDRTLAAGKQPDPSGNASAEVLRAYIRANQGWFCLKLGRLEESHRLLPPCLAVLRSFGAQAELVNALYFIGALAWLAGDYASARAHFLEELALATQIGEQWGIGLAQGNLGLVAQTIGEYEEAQERWRTALAIERTLGDKRMAAAALHFFGRLKCTLGAYDEARTYLHESLVLSGTIGDRWIHGLALGQLGQIALLLGEHAEAVRLLRESLTLVREIGEGWSTLQALNGLGAATLALREFAASRSAFHEALAVAWEMQLWPEVLGALVGLANWMVQQGELEAALAQTVLVLNHSAINQETKSRAAQLCTELEARLTPQQIEAAHASAQATSLDALVAALVASPSSPVDVHPSASDHQEVL